MRKLAWSEYTNTNYLYIASHGVDCFTMPHDHQTYAVVAGLSGEEENVFYKHSLWGEQLIVEDRRETVKLGTGLYCNPSDIHNIHTKGTESTRTLRFYGRALVDQNDSRTFFDLKRNVALQMSLNGMFEPLR